MTSLSFASTRLSAVLLALLVGLALVLGVAASPAGQTAVVKPHPAIEGHIVGSDLVNPPTTAFCRANIGISCYQPFQFVKAYDLQPLYNQGLNGAGRTIVLVESFGSPTIEHDAQVFNQTFGLPQFNTAGGPTLKIIQPEGPVPAFSTTAFGGDMVGWAEETSLDVEWSHAMAPAANILIVATPTDETEGVQGFPEMMAAENYVIDNNLGDVISQSFGATEETFPNNQAILNLRSAFENARQHHVTVLGSSGDDGATDLFSDLSCCYPMRVNSWPSSDPLVTSMGGTQLNLDDAGNRLSPDVVWNDGFGAGGGGVSAVFPRPNFQNQERSLVGGQRGTPDISMSAAVDGGVAVYFTFIRPNSPWHIFGGTSEASPLFAGIVAIADQAAGHRIGYLNNHLYHLSSGIVDVTSGNNSFAGVTGFTAGPGYDLASGLGTIDAAKFVQALVQDDQGDNNQ